MIKYVILDDRMNVVIDSEFTMETMEKIKNDNKMKKVYECKNEVNNTQMYFYKNIDTKYLLIYEV